MVKIKDITDEAGLYKCSFCGFEKTADIIHNSIICDKCHPFVKKDPLKAGSKLIQKIEEENHE
jgi:ribosomal protein L37AE/L43A